MFGLASMVAIVAVLMILPGPSRPASAAIRQVNYTALTRSPLVCLRFQGGDTFHFMQRLYRMLEFKDGMPVGYGPERIDVRPGGDGEESLDITFVSIQVCLENLRLHGVRQRKHSKPL